MKSKFFILCLLIFTQPLIAQNSIKIMTYNLEGMKPGTDPQTRLYYIIQNLKQLNPDIIGLQEINESLNGGGLDNQAKLIADSLSAHFGITYHRYYSYTHLSWYNQFREFIGIISKYPVEQEGFLQLVPGAFPRKVVWNYINTPLGKINFFNTHLDYQSQSIRIQEVQQILQYISTKDASYPSIATILTGDFNDTPLTPTIALLTGGNFFDSYNKANPGLLGYTMPSNAPTSRIDYIFYNKNSQLKIDSSTVVMNVPYRGSNYCSDHLGVMSIFTKTPTASAINWKPFFTLQPNEGINFILDTTAVISNVGVPGLNIANDGRVILGFGGPGLMRRGVAITNDTGKTFTILSGINSPQQIDGGFIYLPDGRIRFVTEEPAPDRTPTRHKSRIVSYISSDGYNFTKEAGIRYQPGLADDSISSVPSVIQIQDSLWRMYYVGDFYRTNGTRTAITTDWGMTWQNESFGNILGVDDVDPHPVYLSNGKIRIYYRTKMRGGVSGPSGIACIDGDGRYFDTTKSRLLIPDGTKGLPLLLDPAVIKYPNGEVACYIGAAPAFGQPTVPKIVAAWSKKTTIVNPLDNSVPKDFKLFQNYPNPFNPSTRIEFYIPNSAFCTLKVFDLLGRGVATLVDEVKETGIHSSTLSTLYSPLPSGVYFYQLRIGSYVETKKMIYLK
ncbi:MAG: endonuclease/exonuclease/phosphatase family protein [Bacteroidetes bacterium]|nr:endonuclease/exonuclease/phosphatase family protein [Bacteroidota bacterium]MBU2584628.1 endonuclease/exonuclease/phosphatase family protein [Bacteroidota bacterium]